MDSIVWENCSLPIKISGNNSNINIEKELEILSKFVIDCLDASTFSSVHFIFYYISGWFALFLGIFGLIGNCLVIFVLAKPAYKSKPINILLRFLAICDLIVVLYIVRYGALAHILQGDEIIYIEDPEEIFIPWGFVVAGHTGSTFFTILVTADRYIATCNPLRSRIIVTTHRTFVGSTITIAFSILQGILGGFMMYTGNEFNAQPTIESKAKNSIDKF